MRQLSFLSLARALFVLAPSIAAAQGVSGDYDCGAPISGPDLIVGSINSICEWGSVGSISGYSIGATACNVGDEAMQFSGDGVHHPVIAQNLFRLESGRIVQLGQSWVKHAFASATENLCCTCQNPGDGLMIGVGCADTYASCQNGVQGPITYFGALVSGLGPRSDIHPTTGAFDWPYTTFGATGDEIYKRLQAETDDLDPALHPTALYFAEVHYVGPDEGGVEKTHNNASYAQVDVGDFDFFDGIWNLAITGPTFQESPAIQAWQDQDPGVTMTAVDDADGGRFHLGSRATDNGDGTWRYEYALHNLNSALPANHLSLLIGAGTQVTGVGFRDVDSHSGEAYDTTDWAPSVAANEVAWAAGTGPNANAVRWGTMYNFWFTADEAPMPGQITLGLLGSTDGLAADGVVPDRPCGTVSYCVAGTHSGGGSAAIGSLGSTSVSTNDLTLTATSGIPNEFGLFYYGPNELKLTFGDGFRCVGGENFRLGPPQTADGSGFAQRALDYTQPPMDAGSGMIQAGSTWNFQHWYRDPGSVSGFNLSDGLSVTFCP